MQSVQHGLIAGIFHEDVLDRLGIVNNDINSAERFDSFGDAGLNIRQFAHVARYRTGSAASRLDCRAGLFQLIEIAGCAGDGRSLLTECNSNCLSKPLAGSGHDRNFARQLTHNASPDMGDASKRDLSAPDKGDARLCIASPAPSMLPRTARHS